MTEVHLGLPSGETFENLKVFVDNLPDYDMLIGMDVMREMDVAITNANGNTKFTYEFGVYVGTPTIVAHRSSI